MTRPLVTVSVPYYKVPPEAFRRAIESILAQTFTDFRLVITNDSDTTSPPWPVIADLTDPRIIRFDLPENRGRYFADAVALAACNTEWFAIHDADDEADPKWLELMLNTAKPDDVAVLAAQHVHARLQDGLVTTEIPTGMGDGALRFRAHLAGLWRTTWAKKTNMIHPEYRVAWDTLATSLPHIVGPYSVVTDPVYTRHRRADSLSNSSRTGHRSVVRRRAVDSMNTLWPKLRDMKAPTPTKVGRVIAATITPEARTQVKTLAAALKGEIAHPAPVTPAAPVYVTVQPDKTPDPLDKQATDLVARDILWGDWAITHAAAAELDARLAALQPRVILEAGSGASTLILARYASATGARVVSLEHSPSFAQATAGLLSSEGLLGVVDIVTAPLTATPDGPWYDTEIPGGIDFALIDGPPMRDGGRAAAWPSIAGHMADRWELWLDDTDRPGEQSALTKWSADPAFAAASQRTIALSGRSTTAVTFGYPVALQDASDVVVTVLATSRPDHLTRTLASLAASVDLGTAEVIALNNGGDEKVQAVLDQYRANTTSTGTVLPIGEATSRLAASAAASTRRYWLHLEDDWAAVTLDPHWLSAATGVLSAHSGVKQVRLRHVADRTLLRHMVTGRPLNWRAHRGGFLLSRDAHWTFNPSLVRVATIPSVFPCGSEKDAQRKLSPCPVAQLVPGAFTHIGDDLSMRTATGNPW